MNNEEYRQVFSNIRPSDGFEERIMNMTEKRKNIRAGRVIAVVLAVVVALSFVAVAANAATDGAIGESVSNAVSETFETFSKKIAVFVNGKKVDAQINVTEETNEEGNIYYIGRASVDLPNGEEEVTVSFGFDDSEGDYAFTAGGVNEIVIVASDEEIEEDAAIPTTATTVISQ